jgi:hypothetical protein
MENQREIPLLLMVSLLSRIGIGADVLMLQTPFFSNKGRIGIKCMSRGERAYFIIYYVQSTLTPS